MIGACSYAPGYFTGDSSYSIAWLAMGNRTLADPWLQQAFLHMDLTHFNVWKERAITGTSARARVCVCVCVRDHCCCCVLVFTHSARCATGGNLNFITGAGGYLQNFLYGYSQIRLAGVRQLVMPLAPSLPPGNVTRVKLRNISLAGVRMSLWYNATDVCLQQEPAPSREAAAGSLQVVCASGEVCVKVVPSSRPACVMSQPLTIRAVPI